MTEASCGRVRSGPGGRCNTEREGRVGVQLTQVPEADSAGPAVGERETLGFGCLAHLCTCCPPTPGSAAPPFPSLDPHLPSEHRWSQEPGGLGLRTALQPSGVTAGQPLSPGPQPPQPRRREAGVNGDRLTGMIVRSRRKESVEDIRQLPCTRQSFRCEDCIYYINLTPILPSRED